MVEFHAEDRRVHALVEQVIAVPMISLDRIPQRSACRRPRIVGQLVEVHIAIHLYQQSQMPNRSTTFQFLAVVVDGSTNQANQGFSTGTQGSTACSGAELVDKPVPRGGGLHGPVSTATNSHSPGAVDEAFTGVFALFNKVNKARGWVQTRGRNWVQTLIHGLRQLVATPWRTRTTSRNQGSESTSEVEEDAANRGESSAFGR